MVVAVYGDTMGRGTTQARVNAERVVSVIRGARPEPLEDGVSVAANAHHGTDVSTGECDRTVP